MSWIIVSIFFIGFIVGIAFGAGLMAWLSINNYTGDVS